MAIGRQAIPAQDALARSANFQEVALGFGPAEAVETASLIDRALKGRDDAAALAKVKAEARALCERFPIYR